MALPEIPSPFTFENTYAALSVPFCLPTLPTPVKAPSWISFNRDLAIELGASSLSSELLSTLLPVFAGNAVLAGSSPVAQVYAGHQFGHFNPKLGDGRAILLGEAVTPQGEHKDIQLKGAGLTPFSRNGDGRSALGPVVREYLVSEAMAVLGIKTTRALAAVATGQNVYREKELPGGVLTRIASSHIRIGTFEYFARRGDMTQVKALADYVIKRHFPDCALAESPYKALFEAVMSAQITLVANWLRVGFIHGVMNTDNMSIVGETIDYGPCAFMDAYDPATVYSAIDSQGRYAFGHQKPILQWNLARLAECLLRLFGDDIDQSVAYAEQILADYDSRFDIVYFDLMAKKIGLVQVDTAKPLIVEFLALLEHQQVDFTLAFRQLGNVLLKQSDEPFLALFEEAGREQGVIWLAHWRQALTSEGGDLMMLAVGMQQINPAIIPRNYHVEAVIAEALDSQKNHTAALYPKFEALHTALKTPFDAIHEGGDFATPPKIAQQRAYQTFCGT